MARYWCVRCGQESNTLSEPHLCKDVAARLREAERHLAREACPPKRGSLDGWLKRMDHFDPAGRHGPRAQAHDWAIDNHGGWIDQCHPRASKDARTS